MKSTLTLLFCCVFLSVIAQQKVLIKNGKTLNDLIPKAWKLLASAQGDINNDGIKDAVLVIQDTDPKNIEFMDGIGNGSIDHNPRLIAVYFGNSNKSYELQTSSATLIPLRSSPNQEVPLAGIVINEKGILSVSIVNWTSAGSWSSSSRNYKFRWQNKALQLIGFDFSDMHRGSMDTTEYSINFMTNKIKTTTYNAAVDGNKNETWRDFKLEKPLLLTDIVTYETMVEDIYL